MPNSPWSSTSSSGSSSAPSSTPLAPSSTVTDLNSVNKLTNLDKIILIQDWNAEQQTNSQLDTQAAALGVSATAYDNAVASLSTNLISAGAPSNWATTWPDGTTMSATSIMTNLNTWWTSIALNRASLQKACQDKITANAAYADALARSPNNLVKNGNCANTAPPAGSYEAAALTYYAPGVGTALSPNGWVRSLTAPASGNVFSQLSENDCVAGDQFYAECNAAYINNIDGNCWIGFSFFNAAGSDVGDYYSSQTPNFSFSSPVRLSLSATAPAGAVKVRVFIQLFHPTAINIAVFNEIYACRMIKTGMLQADAIQTSNYTEVSGNPTAGARMDISNTALKVASNNFQIGSTIFSDYLLARINQGLDGNTSVGHVFYRGSIDVSTRLGAPLIDRLTITRRRWDTTNHVGRLELSYQPSSWQDNLDAMRFLKVVLYRQNVVSGGSTTATLTAIDTYYPVANDRSYYSAGTDSNSGNLAIFTFETVDSGINGGFPAALVSLYNVYGPSAANCFYAFTGNADGSALTNSGAGWPTNMTGGTGGGGGGGGRRARHGV